MTFGRLEKRPHLFKTGDIRSLINVILIDNRSVHKGQKKRMIITSNPL
jgi:hypothetical protein